MASNADEPQTITPPLTPITSADPIPDVPKTPERQIGRQSQANIASPNRPYNTPVVRTENSCKHGFLNPDAEEKQKRFASEMGRWHIGPMPIADFLQEFLPAGENGDEGMPAVEDAFLSVPASDTNEGNLYGPLCQALNSNRCPSFTFVDTSDNAENPGLGGLKPDLCLYADNVIDNVANVKKDNKFIPHFGYMDLFVEIKAKGKDPFAKDPCSDTTDLTGHKLINWPQGRDSQTEVRKKIGQVVSYSSELCGRQHRTHCFSIFICGPEARLILWDRAGAIVSRSFNYKEDPQWLCLFAWRYSKATDAQRGFDMTVQKALPDEEKKFEEVIKKHVKEQLCLEEGTLLNNLVRDHYEKGKVFKIVVDPREPKIPKDNSDKASDDAERKRELFERLKEAATAESGAFFWDEAWYEDEEANANDDKSDPPAGCDAPAEDSAGAATDVDKLAYEQSKPISRCRKYSRPQYFLVSRPVSFPASVAGRGTRGYWAVKLPDESVGEEDFEIAFLKDTWRIDKEGMEIEGEVMVELVEAGVKFVSDIFCQGDVRQSDEKSGCADGSTNEYQATLTDKYAEAGWNCNQEPSHPITKHTHYRMASVEVGYSLRTLKGTKELLHGSRCSFLGAWAAYVLCRRLHRDISLDNIILVRKRGKWRIGYLIDWELSSRADRDGKARDYARSGTWAFMSIASLMGYEGFRHSFQDDMESFYYVVLYASILWLPHQAFHDLKKLVVHFFNEYQELNGKDEGGERKQNNRQNRRFVKRFEWTNLLLREWIEEALQLQKETDDTQPKWTPEALHNLWKTIDDKDLPAEDRSNHPLKDKYGRTIIGPIPPPATLSAARDGQVQMPTGSGRAEGSLTNTRRGSSKRNRDAAGLEGHSDSIKRQRGSDPLPKTADQ